jgi:hypothetical protein
MISGSCLCGGVAFEVERAVGPFELCHCSRCRKASGSAFVAGLGVLRRDFRLLRGAELIRIYDAPLRTEPPAFRTCFCATCGSPAPDVSSDGEWLEIPAGLLDADPVLRPDKHIFVDVKSPWFAITDELPQLDQQALRAARRAAPRP